MLPYNTFLRNARIHPVFAYRSSLSRFNRPLPSRINRTGKAPAGCCSSARDDAKPTGADWARRVGAWKENQQGNIRVATQNIANANHEKLQKVFSVHPALAALVTEVGVGAGYSEVDFLTDLERINPHLATICVPRRASDRRSGGVALVCAGELIGREITKVQDYNEFDWLLAVEVHLPERNDPLALVVCYTPGNGKYYDESMFTNLGRVFADLSSRTSGVVLAGDFNFRLGMHPGSWCSWVHRYFPRSSMDGKEVNVRRGSGLMAAGGIAVSGRVPGDLNGGVTNYHRVNGPGTLIDDAFVNLGAFPDVCYCRKGPLDRSISTHIPITYEISRESFWEHNKVKSM